MGDLATQLDAYARRHDGLLAWTCPHGDIDLGFATGWVDVTLHHQHELTYNWTVTIVSLDDEDEADDETIRLAYDRHIVSLWDDDETWWSHRIDVPAAVGDYPGVTTYDTLRRRHPELGWLALDGDVHTAGGWSADALDGALNRWADVHLTADATFVCDVGRTWRTGLEERLDDRLDQLAVGNVIQLGENVAAVGGAFDELLSMDPDDAAAITVALSEIAGRDPRPAGTDAVDDALADLLGQH